MSCKTTYNTLYVFIYYICLVTDVIVNISIPPNRMFISWRFRSGICGSTSESMTMTKTHVHTHTHAFTH